MKTEIITSDVLIIGGGTSGCYAALTIAEQNPELKVVIAEKANIIRSGCLAAGVNALNSGNRLYVLWFAVNVWFYTA